MANFTDNINNNKISGKCICPRKLDTINLNEQHFDTTPTEKWCFNFQATKNDTIQNYKCPLKFLSPLIVAPNLSPPHIPPPGTHNFFQRKERYISAFGSQRTPIRAVKIICSIKNEAECYICNEKPHGDYWYEPKNKNILCRPCMIREIAATHCRGTFSTDVLRRKYELQRYIRARYCDYYHTHFGSPLKLTFLPKKEFIKKERIENYLASYDI